MAGVVVDASRMHLTKADWQDLLAELSQLAGRQIAELHTRHFYAGNSVFRDVDGDTRADLIAAIFDWLAERRHHVVYSSVLKESYRQAHARGDIPDELNTPWRFLGFHLILAMQKHCQGESGVKGHTIFVFDNEERERMRFTDLIARPPAWSDEYYKRRTRREQLDQIVDVPYFGDSREVVLVQLADFVSFFLRRHAEIQEDLVGPEYADEREKIEGWIETLATRSIGRRFMYPKVRREHATDLFFRHAPQSIRILG
jgi:hypothetical protein